MASNPGKIDALNAMVMQAMKDGNLELAQVALAQIKKLVTNAPMMGPPLLPAASQCVSPAPPVIQVDTLRGHFYNSILDSTKLTYARELIAKGAPVNDLGIALLPCRLLFGSGSQEAHPENYKVHLLKVAPTWVTESNVHDISIICNKFRTEVNHYLQHVVGQRFASRFKLAADAIGYQLLGGADPWRSLGKPCDDMSLRWRDTLSFYRLNPNCRLGASSKIRHSGKSKAYFQRFPPKLK
jgi:hypothetical protein